MKRIPFLLGLVAAALTLPAFAQVDSARKVEARLIAETGEITPGGTVTLALEENIRPGWHTYWRNPGEAGEPTQIAWTLPPGWKAGAIEWPYPKRLPAGPLMNYGYEGRPWLLVPLTAPASAAPGAMVVLKAHASWLVCSETLCVPEDQDVSLPLTVVTQPATIYPTVAEQFAAARARMPVPSPWSARFAAGQSLDIFLAAPKLQLRDAAFFPDEEGYVKGSARQELGKAGSGIVLRLGAAANARSARVLGGVLVLTSMDGSVRALDIRAHPGDVPPADFPAHTDMGLLLALLFAFAGGLVLNLMPCVLPVLAMKAIAVASKPSAERGEAARQGLSYGAGAVASFLVLGLAVVLLRAGGDAVGWGFQLQEPRVVAGFALLMFAVGLNFSGVFELPSGISAGDALTRRGGVPGAFFTGVLAVAVAAPCTAPFMATAIGYALTQGTPAALGVFFFLGIGFALPFVAFGLSPALVRLLPKPGAWMVHFKEFLAFPMYGAAAWLVWVVAQEAGEAGLAATLATMVALAFAAWLWRVSRDGSRLRGAGRALALVSFAFALSGITFAHDGSSGLHSAAADPGPLHAEHYSAARLEELREEGRPVFVDATAAWCITCLVNERIALSQSDVARAFARTRTAYLVADWTRRDPEISALLAAHNRSGVPLYLYFKPGASEAQVLPQILTPQAVLAVVDGH